MGESSEPTWVEACEAWTVRAVLDEIHGLATAAASEVGTYDSGGDRIRVLGKGAVFTVGALSPRGVASAEAQFAGGRTDGNQLKDPDCIVAATAIGSANGPIMRETVARLALDCATGTPCLLVVRTANGDQIDEGSRQVTVKEFTREVLLPVLFPALVAVDHSPTEPRSPS